MQPKPATSLEEELETLRRELSQPRVREETDAAAATPDVSGARADIEKVLHDLQETLGEAAEDAEETIAAHPFAAVAAAFLLGILVANLMSRGK